MPGPARKPDDQRARRNASAALVQLPAEGRKGRAPKWPLPDEIAPAAMLKMWLMAVETAQADLDDPDSTPQQKRSARNRLNEARREAFMLEEQIGAQRDLETRLWRALWKTPQADQWEKRSWYREVALFARHQVKAELGSLRDSTEARQRESTLGLNDRSMRALGWEITSNPASAFAGDGPAKPKSVDTYGHLRVVADQ